jgi:hypothetical protein
MVLHCQTFSPPHAEILDEEQLRRFVRQTVDRAGAYGFTNRGPIRLFLELEFLLGSAFDTDPQYPWTAKILQSSHDQMERAGWLFQKTIDYQQEVDGPDGEHRRAALERFAVLLQKPLPLPSKDDRSVSLREMHKMFPQKTVFVGQEWLAKLVRQGRQTAPENGLSTSRGECLLVLLMFMFGHGCMRDPLFPWVRQALHDSQSNDPEGRAARLAEEARAWIQRLLASSPEGAKV